MGVLTSISRGLEAVSTPLGGLPDMVYAVAAASFLLLLIVYVFVTPSWREKKRKRGRAIWVWLMFAIYVLLILAVTILGKRSGDSAVDMGIFTGSWVMETLVKVAAGTVAFVPLGALIMILMKGKYQAAKSMGASFALTLCVEILQLVLKTGVFDLGNLLFHTIGAGIGIVLVIFWKYAFSRKSAFSYAMRLMLSILIVLMLLETAAFGAYHVLRTTGQEHMDENISVAENQMISKNTDGSDAKVSSDPDVIWYNGKAYRYNHDLVTMLVMGIDQESDTIEEKDDVSGESGQADTIFLMVMDKSKDEIKVIEEAYAKTETPVVSNNSAHRWTPDVPMVVPEINAEHFEVIKDQKKRLGTTRGFIAVKPNCSIQSYAPCLAAWKEFGPKELVVTTYQAISGAGKTFKDWPEMLGNIIPFIGGEEEKSEQEPLRVLGKVENGEIVKAELPKITCQCVRVPVLNGHTAAVFINFEKKPTKEQLIEKLVNFKGFPQEAELPSAPKQFIQYLEEENRPQVTADVDYERGMGVSIGRLREDSMYDFKFIGLSHNTVRGAAGGAVLCAEALTAKGYIAKK